MLKIDSQTNSLWAQELTMAHRGERRRPATIAPPAVNFFPVYIPRKARSSDMPPELWLHVFPNLSRKDISSVSLTCQSFRAMAQPLLFSLLSVPPFVTSAFSATRTLRTRAAYERTLQRLKFYASTRIAPFVKKCTISPSHIDPKKGPNPEGDVDPRLFIDAVFKLLPRLVNLENLSCSFVELDARRMRQIHQLSLRSLELVFCSIEQIEIPRQIRVQSLQVDAALDSSDTFHIASTSPSGPIASDFLTVIDPYRLQRLRLGGLDGEEGRVESMLEGMSAIDSFQGLQTLHVPFKAILSRHFFDALSRCPNLEELHVARYHTSLRVDNLSFRLLPVPLKVFEGPESAVLSFAHGRSLREVNLWGFDTRGSQGLHRLGRNDCDESTLPHVLTALRNLCPGIETLELSVYSSRSPALTNLGLFPNLKHVRVSVSRADNLSNLVTDLSVLKYPPSLISFRVASEATGPKPADIGMFCDTFAPLAGYISEQCPAFTTLLIKYGALMLRQISWERDWNTRRRGVIGNVLVGSRGNYKKIMKA